MSVRCSLDAGSACAQVAPCLQEVCAIGGRSRLTRYARMCVVLSGGNMAEERVANQTVLAVLPAADDRKSLAAIFACSHWKLRFAGAPREVRTALRALPGVVISEREFSKGRGWKDVLFELQKMEDPPPLIVADRLADDRLWAEVLNLGAHDLLAKPFDAREVLYAVTAACLPFETQPAAGA